MYIEFEQTVVSRLNVPDGLEEEVLTILRDHKDMNRVVSYVENETGITFITYLSETYEIPPPDKQNTQVYIATENGEECIYFQIPK